MTTGNLWTGGALSSPHRRAEALRYTNGRARRSRDSHHLRQRPVKNMMQPAHTAALHRQLNTLQTVVFPTAHAAE